MHRLLLERNDVDVFASINLPTHAKKFDCWQFASLLATGKVRSMVVHKKSTEDVIATASRTSNPSFPYKERHEQNQEPKRTPSYYKGVLLQHFWNNDAYAAMQRYEAERNAPPYELVIRVRPDVVYLDNDLSGFDLDALHEYAVRWHGARYINVPESNAWGGITDMFAIVSRPCSDIYFRMLHDMEHYLTKDSVPFHPETLTKFAVVLKGGCQLVLLEDVLQNLNGGHSAERKPFDYCVARKNGCNMRPTPLPPLSCTYPSEHGNWDTWRSGM